MTRDLNNPAEGDLKVWWIPQVPGKPFEVAVPCLQSASLLLDTLARYDAFQFENRIKPDYCNAGGLMRFEDGDWCDWWSEDGEDFDEIRRDPDALVRAIVLDTAARAKARGA